MAIVSWHAVNVKKNSIPKIHSFFVFLIYLDSVGTLLKSEQQFKTCLYACDVRVIYTWP